MSVPPKKRPVANAKEPSKVPAHIPAKAGEGVDENQTEFTFGHDLAGPTLQEKPVTNEHLARYSAGDLRFRNLVKCAFFPVIYLLQIVREFKAEIPACLKIGSGLLAVFGIYNASVVIHELVFDTSLRFDASHVVSVLWPLICALLLLCLLMWAMNWHGSQVADENKAQYHKPPTKPKPPRKPRASREKIPHAKRHRK